MVLPYGEYGAVRWLPPIHHPPQVHWVAVLRGQAEMSVVTGEPGRASRGCSARRFDLVAIACRAPRAGETVSADRRGQLGGLIELRVDAS
jgi:hypothetical protein